MSSRKLNIVQVSTSDRGGGAEGSARNLFCAYRDRGHGSWLAVGTKTGADPDVYELPRHPRGPAVTRPLWWLSQWVRGHAGRRGALRRLSRALERVSVPSRFRDWWRGREEFQFPGGGDVLGVIPERPDLVHCHNLHGWYFDLTSLPALSARLPVILNLRDAWLLTGHCGYPIDCPRWETGCGQCPDLKRYPGTRIDATAANWCAKRDIYARSRLYVTAPSQWLLDMAKRSMLGAEDYRVIPNGIDTDVFCPGDRDEARQRLGLPADRPIVLFVSASARNVYKDPETMRDTIEAVMSAAPDTVVVALGARMREKRRDSASFLQVPFQSRAADVAAYYRAADIFVHTAAAEAFGKTVTEAMACGTTVVASAVGGIVEQIEDGVCGRLAPPGDAPAMARAIVSLLGDRATCARLGAAAEARGARYSLSRQADAFLAWYEAILEHIGAPSSASAPD